MFLYTYIHAYVPWIVLPRLVVEKEPTVRHTHYARGTRHRISPLVDVQKGGKTTGAAATDDDISRSRYAFLTNVTDVEHYRDSSASRP